MVIDWVLSLFNSGDEGYSDDDFDTFMPSEYKSRLKRSRQSKEAYDDMIKSSMKMLIPITALPYLF